MSGDLDRSIILTGATGFLGAFLMAGLLKSGYHVTVLGRSSKDTGLSQRLNNLLNWFGIELQANLTSIEADFSKKHLGLDDMEYDRLCLKSGKVVHCASDTSFAERNRERVMSTNVLNLPAILDFTADSHAEHLYYVSSAYAWGACEGLCMESSVTNQKFTNVYEESKAQAEGIILHKCEEYKVPLSILRPSIVYGNSKTGESLKFNALYYAVKSVLYIRDIFIKNILSGGGERSEKWGVSLSSDGVLNMPLEIFLPNRGTVNLIPVDYFVETALHIISNPDSEGIYHIASDNPPDMSVLIKYTERFLKVRGMRALWEVSSKEPNPAEELFDRFIKQYRPYLSDQRIFDGSRTKDITHGLCAPLFSYDIFKRCMDYAVNCDWGNMAGFPK